MGRHRRHLSVDAPLPVGGAPRQLALRHGATLSVEQQWELARLWYQDSRGAGSAGPHNRMSSEWRRRIPDEAQAVFDSFGLTGDFWRLSG
ncbi:MAG: hypothetical protein GEU68_11275 [Actinobacteria bacterium]|nr:hypothetical protein [Actinomycetota bacterium]